MFNKLEILQWMQTQKTTLGHIYNQASASTMWQLATFDAQFGVATHFQVSASGFNENRIASMEQTVVVALMLTLVQKDP